MIVSVKERILAIRLIEMQERNPEYAKRLGVEVKMEDKGGDNENTRKE